MRRGSIHDEIVASFWSRATAELVDCITDKEPNLTTARALRALLTVGFSLREPAIEGHFARLNSWAEHFESDADDLDESSTGLFGVWLGLRHQLHRPVATHLPRLFVVSVERNLQKPGALRLATSVDLLNAVAVGLGTFETAELWAKVSEQLSLLLQNATAIEIAQMIESWESVKDTKTIPLVAMQHRLESILSNDQSSVLDKSVANYAKSKLDEIRGSPKIEQEIRFLESLQMMSGSKATDSSQHLKFCALLLPYLKGRISFGSLFASWQRYVDLITKRARLENFLSRYGFSLALIVFIGIVIWPWVQSLEGKNQIPILSAALTIIMLLTTYTLETISELYGRQLWQKRKVEMYIGALGALIVLASAIIAPLIK